MKKINLKLAIALTLSVLSSNLLATTVVFATGQACSKSADCRGDEYCDGYFPPFRTGAGEVEEEIKGECKLSSLTDTKFPVSNVLKLDKDQQPQKYFDDKENSPIVSFILSVIDFATMVIGSIATILIIVSGFMFMFAQGNEQNLTNAKDMFKYAVIGLIVTFLSYTIATFVQSIFLSA